MSDNLSKEAKLTALVLSAPDGTPKSYCALDRAYLACESPPFRQLNGFAESLGFSLAEAHGIMNGWDEAAGKRPAFVDERIWPVDPAGVALGKKLYALVCATEHVTEVGGGDRDPTRIWVEK